MRRILLATVILLVVPGVAYAGGGGVDTTGCAGYTEGDAVSMRDSCFAGTAHFAPSDTTITVNNDGQLPHTLTAVDGSFDTGTLGAGESAQLSFDEPGIYRVFCSLHGTPAGEGMAGVVVVGEAVPASVIPPTDTSAISEAVAAENEQILAAIDAQQSSIRGLNATEAKLMVALDGLGSGEAGATPRVVMVPGDVGTERIVVMVVVGLAAGLALAALLTGLRLRIAERSETRLGRLEPSVDA